jgi:trk system potassium uptake protein TrkH
VAAKTFFIIIGILGGCAFSMAGGIRIHRLRLLLNAVRKKGDQPTRRELKAILLSIGGFFAALVVLSLIFSTIGISMLDSVFEVSSAMTTNGISMGITTILMPAGYKWLLIFAMLVGRLEIVTIIAAVSGLPIFLFARRFGDSLKKRLPKIIKR